MIIISDLLAARDKGLQFASLVSPATKNNE